MNWLRQIVSVTMLNLKNLPSRMGPSLVIVAGMAAAIGVLVSILSLAVGYAELQRRTGDPGRAIILSQTADTEGSGAIQRGVLGDIMAAPGIARDTDGASLTDPEYTSILLVKRRSAGRALLTLRGMGRKALAVRPELKIVAGRMFRPGARELIVGIAIQAEFRELEVGDKVIMQDGQWPVVGSFTTGGDVLEGQIIGDAAILMSAAKRNNFNSVIARLGGPGSLENLQHALAANPRLGVRVERQLEYYERTSQDTAGFFHAVAYAVGGIMALGALFGALNTMYSAVGARTQEIATLRALGFGGMAVAVSVIAESILLAMAGALIGIGLAWALFNGQGYAFGEVLFHLTVSPALVGVGLGWALAVAVLGGVLPAVRAARLPVVDALRAT
ncbi:MAG TPA: FtsX-like permease family protein [Rhizomicrobium sp.]|nr:FtsX-like permease family protein [Rhizomicrobium sp.]